ncbi:zinc finger CCCH domain-containing protein 53-like [Panicum miliaceum]|uniref:Zinc finger CCCH domain-containing protein 53-like n=1 Tax=Panicum miliaceum TaxID=4540 RepID=A0A3L6Q292_PANMI|nr:zinc finger CCCH domain-containing protein 53-like [Panicum miliaceum]
MAVMRAKASAAAQPQQHMAPAFPFSPSPPKGVNLNFLLHHQQRNEPQRAAAAAAATLLGGADMHRFPVRSPRMDRGDHIASPAARQIYLTFPADSTFSEEDVSNYFSMYGPVQDVRIPYQQKRMFGFVTFVYAESPYKEKGKVPDRFRKLQHQHHGDFAGCTSPTGLLDSRDPFDLQQPQIGPRMMHRSIANHEAFLRRKLQEQQQAAELQQAIEMEQRRFMGLQLLDLRSTDNKLNSTGLAMSAPAAAAISATDAEGKHEEQQEEDGVASPKQTVNLGKVEKRESGPVTATQNVACGFRESGVVDHILPESPFASPTKASIDTNTIAQNGNTNHSSPHHVASYLFPPTSTLDLPPYKSCFFQVPRFSPGHEAIGM